MLPVQRGAVRASGAAPLAAVVRLDRELSALLADADSLRSRLLDVFELAVELLARAVGVSGRERRRVDGGDDAGDPVT